MLHAVYFVVMFRFTYARIILRELIRWKSLLLKNVPKILHFQFLTHRQADFFQWPEKVPGPSANFPNGQSPSCQNKYNFSDSL